MPHCRLLLGFSVAVALVIVHSASAAELTRLTSAIPFPRGLALADPDGDGAPSLYVLSRGRVRGSGGVDPKLDDRAGTIWEVDPATGEAVVFADPTEPPFRLLDRSLANPTDDEATDRPYCSLRWDEATRSFYLCAFSGIDLADNAEAGGFRKNYTDAVLRYDVDEEAWSEVDRHDPADGATYPGSDGRGWTKGPDNCLVISGQVLVAAKDNNRVVLYDPTGQREPQVLLGESVRLANRDGEERNVLGHSALGYRDGWLYVGFRTSGEIIRVPLALETPESGDAVLHVSPERAELLAELEPFDRETGRSANVTDLDIGPEGDVYVVSAKPAKIFRFTPDPSNVRDYVDGSGAWLDLSAMTNNDRMKSENVLAAKDGAVYVTSGDAYGNDQAEGLGGTVWVYR